MIDSPNTEHFRPEGEKPRERTAAVEFTPRRSAETQRNAKVEESEQSRHEYLDREIERSFALIRSSLKNKIDAGRKDIERTQADDADQWFWERMASGSDSHVAELEAMVASASGFLETLEANYASAALSTVPERKESFLQELKDLTALDANNVPIMGPDGQYVSELLRNKPDFEKLRSEFESREAMLDRAEQGLQYAQTALEIAASYAGPQALAAALIPKYVMQLSTGQSSPAEIALAILEDVVSAYIGSGKVAKTVLQKLGPHSRKIMQAFEGAQKGGWTKEAVKATALQCVEVFRDTGLQNAFAWGKEQITGEEAQYVTLQETAAGQITGKVISGGLKRPIGNRQNKDVDVPNPTSAAPASNASGRNDSVEFHDRFNQAIALTPDESRRFAAPRSQANAESTANNSRTSSDSQSERRSRSRRQEEPDSGSSNADDDGQAFYRKAYHPSF